MKNKVTISRINIRIGDKEIPLTLDEAQELRQILDETFGQKTVFYPLWWERPYIRHWEAPTITCSSDSTIMTLALSSGNIPV